MSAAMESIQQLGLVGKTTVVGLAKNEEELFFPGDSRSIKLPWDSNSLKLVRRIRDEVHRYGITFHRNKRSKGTFTNELETIAGIGPQTARQLLTAFRSVKKIKEQNEEELASIVGSSKAKLLLKYFTKEKS